MKVEIKETVSGDVVALAEQKLAAGSSDTTRRRIFFSEVRVDPGASLVLAARGLIVRSRRGSQGGDVTIKLRGPQGCLDTGQWDNRTKHSDAKLEGDWAGSKQLLSASLDRKLDGHRGNTDPRSASDVIDSLSNAQLSLAKDWMVPLGGLEPLGPVQSRRWSNPDLGCKVEVWEVGDGLRFLEASTVVDADDAPTVQRALHDALRDLGLPEGAFADTTKTDAVLRHRMKPHVRRR